jgi:DNA-binding transcriptional MerR regulator
MMGSAELCKVVGISYRQLDYWCRLGYITCERDGESSGHYRRFGPEAIAQATTLRDRSLVRRAPLSSPLVNAVTLRS